MGLSPKKSRLNGWVLRDFQRIPYLGTGHARFDKQRLQDLTREWQGGLGHSRLNPDPMRHPPRIGLEFGISPEGIEPQSVTEALEQRIIGGGDHELSICRGEGPIRANHPKSGAHGRRRRARGQRSLEMVGHPRHGGVFQ
jgi:hypothetical protein